MHYDPAVPHVAVEASRRKRTARWFGAVALATASGVLAAGGFATADPPRATAATAAADTQTLPFPVGYSRWTHIKSGLINAGHAAYARFGGLHHIYANATALDGYRTGRFADGSVLVYDLFEATDKGDATIDQGPRRHIDVMVKDSARFAATGGWGYAEFAAGERRDRLRTAQRDGCAACHASQKDNDQVFSRWREDSALEAAPAQ
ncbi:cytochrome P460 family protein [Lysobacter antibioticus]|uniref:cytochrome P460 family protein n=1 Tax=Lysobacter antibioticus TaxID=84531 RepID=UPI0009DE7D25|nr:cytochrome P460 family protein [Lysobacter antibioticus]